MGSQGSWVIFLKEISEEHLERWDLGWLPLKEQVDIKTIELKASEKQYRNLFEKISDSIFVFEKKTYKFLDCNDTVLRVYNYTKEELRKNSYSIGM